MFACGIRKRLDASVEQVPAAIEYHFRHFRVFRFFGNRFTDALGRFYGRGRFHFALDVFIERRCGSDRDLLAEQPEQGSLAGARASGEQNVEARRHARAQELLHVCGQRAARDEVLDAPDRSR